VSRCQTWLMCLQAFEKVGGGQFNWHLSVQVSSWFTLEKRDNFKTCPLLQIDFWLQSQWQIWSHVNWHGVKQQKIWNCKKLFMCVCQLVRTVIWICCWSDMSASLPHQWLCHGQHLQQQKRIQIGFWLMFQSHSTGLLSSTTKQLCASLPKKAQGHQNDWSELSKEPLTSFLRLSVISHSTFFESIMWFHLVCLAVMLSAVFSCCESLLVNRHWGLRHMLGHQMIWFFKVRAWLLESLKQICFLSSWTFEFLSGVVQKCVVFGMRTLVSNTQLQLSLRRRLLSEESKSLFALTHDILLWNKQFTANMVVLWHPNVLQLICHHGMSEAHASFFSSVPVKKLAKMIFKQKFALPQCFSTGVAARAFDCWDVWLADSLQCLLCHQQPNEMCCTSVIFVIVLTQCASSSQETTCFVFVKVLFSPLDLPMSVSLPGQTIWLRNLEVLCHAWMITCQVACTVPMNSTRREDPSAIRPLRLRMTQMWSLDSSGKNSTEVSLCLTAFTSAWCKTTLLLLMVMTTFSFRQLAWSLPDSSGVSALSQVQMNEGVPNKHGCVCHFRNPSWHAESLHEFSIWSSLRSCWLATKDMWADKHVGRDLFVWWIASIGNHKQCSTDAAVAAVAAAVVVESSQCALCQMTISATMVPSLLQGCVSFTPSNKCCPLCFHMHCSSHHRHCHCIMTPSSLLLPVTHHFFNEVVDRWWLLFRRLISFPHCHFTRVLVTQTDFHGCQSLSSSLVLFHHFGRPTPSCQLLVIVTGSQPVDSSLLCRTVLWCTDSFGMKQCTKSSLFALLSAHLLLFSFCWHTSKLILICWHTAGVNMQPELIFSSTQPLLVASSAHNQHPHTTCFCSCTTQAEADLSFCSLTQIWNSLLFVWHTVIVHSLWLDDSSSQVSLFSGQFRWWWKLSLLATTSTTAATACCRSLLSHCSISSKHHTWTHAPCGMLTSTSHGQVQGIQRLTCESITKAHLLTASVWFAQDESWIPLTEPSEVLDAHDWTMGALWAQAAKQRN